MLAVTPHETFGFFLQEAKAMDIPIFLLSFMTDPPWFFPQDGMAVNVKDEDRETIAGKFRQFLANLTSYRPRETIRAHLSHTASAARLRNLTGNLFDGCRTGKAQWVS